MASSISQILERTFLSEIGANKSKAPVPISSRLSGILIFVSLGQPSNAAYPIRFTFSQSFISLKLSQLEKAKSSIFSRSSFVITFFT